MSSSKAKRRHRDRKARRRAKVRKGQPVLLHNASRRCLESYANHYGFKHLADELPLNEKLQFYKKKLRELQEAGEGPLYGEPMKHFPMSLSDWPNQRYKEKVRKAKKEREALEATARNSD